MDRWVANTLRTLGLIILAIVVIAFSLGLALLGLCFAILSSADHHGGGAPPLSNNFFYLGIAAAIVVLVIGIFAIAALARVIFRESKLQDQNVDRPVSPPYPLIPSATPPIPPQPTVPPSSLPALPATPPQARNLPSLATHLSPASYAAIDRLVLAIAAQASVQLIVGVIEWLWAAQIQMQRFRLHGPLLLAWSLAAMAPYLILAFTLRRSPGPTAFSFCLVIPGIRSFLGLFGQTASIILFLRTFHSPMPLLSAIPWALDVLIFYLAWKAIRLTGIQPTPGRLILSAIDIFLYSTSLPIIFLALNYFWR